MGLSREGSEGVGGGRHRSFQCGWTGGRGGKYVKSEGEVYQWAARASSEL